MFAIFLFTLLLHLFTEIVSSILIHPKENIRDNWGSDLYLCWQRKSRHAMAANTSSYMQQYHTQPGHCPAKIVMYWKIIPAYIRDSFGHFLMIYMYGFVCVCKIQTIYMCIMYITRLRCQLNNQALSPPETDMAATSPGNPAKIRHLSSQCPIHIAQKLHYHHSHISSLLLHWFLAVWFDYTTNNYPEQSKGRRCSNMQFSKKNDEGFHTTRTWVFRKSTKTSWTLRLRPARKWGKEKATT